MAALAQQFGLAGDLLHSVLEPRIGTTIQGRLQAGLLFTPAYISSIKAQVAPRWHLAGIADRFVECCACKMETPRGSHVFEWGRVAAASERHCLQRSICSA